MTTAWLIAESGLSVSQVARAIGFTPRAVHGWASELMQPPREAAQRLRAFQELVSGLGLATPGARRAAMLDSSAGPSPFAQFLAGAPDLAQIHFPVPVAERLVL